MDEPVIKNYKKVHAIYLAIIAVLIIIIVYFGAKTVQTSQTLNDIEEKFGIKSDLRSSIPRKEPLRNFDESMLKEKSFDEFRAEFDSLIERVIELEEFGKKNKLSEACAYALRGGKRLRPIIVMEISRANMVNANKTGIINKKFLSKPNSINNLQLIDPADAALSIEYLHAASLIIDDLPSFDNDVERRGQPSVHAASNPAVAQMAALSLVSGAFQNIARQIDWIKDNCPDIAADRIGTRLCHDISHALGALGAAGGQYKDSEMTIDELDDDIISIMQMKTATFFEIAFVTGWLISNGSQEDASELQKAGKYFGTAFQIADDIGDMKQDALRKSQGKPGWNYANEFGEETAREVVSQQLNACRRILEDKKLFTPIWREIYHKVWKMT